MNKTDFLFLRRKYQKAKKENRWLDAKNLKYRIKEAQKRNPDFLGVSPKIKEHSKKVSTPKKKVKKPSPKPQKKKVQQENLEEHLIPDIELSQEQQFLDSALQALFSEKTMNKMIFTNEEISLMLTLLVREFSDVNQQLEKSDSNILKKRKELINGLLEKFNLTKR